MNGIKCSVNMRTFRVPSWNQSKKQTFSMIPKKVIIHNTYNKATARAEASYMTGNSNWTSFHTVIDEKEIIECVPFNRNTWHCGNQYGNRNYIGIEIARSTGNPAHFSKAEENTAKYVAAILKKYGWGIEKVSTHQACSGKYCPHKTLDKGWNRFLNMVKAELEGNSLGKDKVTEGGYSVQVNVGVNDVLNVREKPSSDSKKISTYRNNSIIYVQSIIKNYEGTWYKIPNMGYVSAKYCKGIDKVAVNKPKIILYEKESDLAMAKFISYLFFDKFPIYRDNGTRTKKDYDIVYIGGQGKDRIDTAKILINKYFG